MEPSKIMTTLVTPQTGTLSLFGHTRVVMNTGGTDEKKNWIDKFYLCRANILLISLIIFIQYKQKRGRHRILFRMIKQAIAFHKVKLIEKCIHWIFNLFKWRVKIRYLASLLEVMVLDFQYFGWNLLGPPRTIPYGHWEHLSWSKGAPFSPLIK